MKFDGRWRKALRPQERGRRSVVAPDWFEFLTKSFQTNSSFSTDCLDLMEEPGFANAIQPLCVEVRRTLCHHLDKWNAQTEKMIDVDLVAGHLEKELRERLSNAVVKCFVVTMGALAQEGNLPGETSEDRYAVFKECLNDPDFALEILRRFPVLARRISIMATNWQEACHEFLARFCSDRETLQAEGLLRPDAGKLLRAEAVGDPHRGGRQGFILTFESGDKLVYKARSVEMEASFQVLLEWIGARNQAFKLKTCNILSCDGYGWAEFIEARPCETLKEAKDFFFRQGANLALLHVLRGTDMHHENLIACACNPILVDLETLFHPDMRSGIGQSATERVQNNLYSSVRRTHLLPIVMGNEVHKSGRYDIGGLGFSDEENRRVEVFKWVARDSDEMRIEHRKISLEAEKNLPTLNGKRVDVRQHCECVVEGFKLMLGFLKEHAREMQLQDGPLFSFRTASQRIVPRPTQFYSQLLFDSWDPDLNDDAERLESFLLDELEKQTENQKHLRDAVAFELEDLWSVDIPYFHKRINDKSLNVSDRSAIEIPNMSNGWDDCSAQLDGIDADQSLQISLIRWSLYDLKTEFDHVPTPAILTEIRGESDPIHMATRLADDLLAKAEWKDDHVSWLTVSDAVD
ncbi:MAG: type 2 lanthipeptide synthetase LanM, partial [Hyphomicrobiales bacterium]|nr:type 2 lanthipeptide synthetase LanM [Hyphomicrobiales bacterium]